MIIVQLGANRGYDGLTKWINENNPEIEKLILVEPFTIHHESLEKCYKDIENKKIDSTAIGLNSGEFSLFWTPADGPLFEVTSLVKEHVTKHWGSNIEINELKVKVKTLDQLLSEYNLTKIDWLLIDVEGLDAEVALTFPWEKYDINKVDIEKIHFAEKHEQVINLFKSLGYQESVACDLYGYDISFEKIK